MNLLDSAALHVSVKDAMKVLPAGQNEGEVIVSMENSGAQRIRIICVPSNLRGFLSLFVCPDCGHKTRKLFLTDDKNSFLCRQCCGIRYKTQTDPSLKKTPQRRKFKTIKTPELTLEEVKKRLAEFMGKKGLPQGL